MLYFFHHYELPVILQHAQLQQIILRAQNPQGNNTAADGRPVVESELRDPTSTVHSEELNGAISQPPPTVENS